MQTCWGFVEEGALHVRSGNYFIRLESNAGSFSGLGIDFIKTYRYNAGDLAVSAATSVILENPFLIAGDALDIGLNGNTGKLAPIRLFRLNTETGDLE